MKFYTFLIKKALGLPVLQETFHVSILLNFKVNHH